MAFKLDRKKKDTSGLETAIIDKKTIESLNYQSRFDFEAYEVEKEKQQQLIQFEQVIKNSETKVLDTMLVLCESFFKAKQLLSNNKTGTFMAWYDTLGYNSEAVSVILKRHDLYLETQLKNTMIAPVRIIKFLTAKKSNFSIEDKKRVLQSDNPKEEIEYIFRQSEHIIQEAEKVKESIEEYEQSHYEEDGIFYKKVYTQKDIFIDLKDINAMMKTKKLKDIQGIGKELTKIKAWIENQLTEN